jgi:hypothetical protein
LVEFLSYSGCRKGEAARVNGRDCDFEKGEITVLGDPATGTTLMRVHECQGAINSACKLLGIARFTHHDLRHLFATRCIESGVDIPTVSRWLGHKDGGALAMKTYGHLRDQHSANMAQKVVFTEEATNVVRFPLAAPSQSGESYTADSAGKKAIAQAKAKYAYPWWASKNSLEVFWGQLNEAVQIVPMEKFHICAKEAMGREVFSDELADRQSLKEEFSERIPKATLVELTGKIHPKDTDGNLRAS